MARFYIDDELMREDEAPRPKRRFSLGPIADPQFYRDMASNVPDAARGLLAQTLGAPVDMATAMMRPFGYKTPDANVVGSTDWIGKKMGADVNRMPFRITSMLPTGADDLMRLGPSAAALLFHGSPHKFDKFDMSKVGTGEGAQAYGHGLYFADNPHVARSYQRGLSDHAIEIGGERVMPKQHSIEDRALAWVRSAVDSQSTNPFQFAKAQARSILGKNSSVADDIAAQIDKWQEQGAKITGGGSLYKVDIPDEKVAKMLDWDKPLSQQPESVRKVLETKFGLRASTDGALTGEQIYHYVASQTQGIKGPWVKFGKENTQAAGSDLLRSSGIPGIKYLDQGSRTLGKGTSNYVVFDAALPIVGRE
jgi:hypothetical protein